MESAEFFKLNIGGYIFHPETIIATWLVMIIFTVFIIIATKRFQLIPGKAQSIFEMIVDFFDRTAVDMMGEEGREYTPIAVFIFIAILLFNWMCVLPGELKIGGMLIFMPPTRDINTTLALALCSFVLCNYFGFRKKGVKYFFFLIEPIPEMLPSLEGLMILMIIPLFPLFLFINVVEQGARVLSLTVRLFCNIISDHIVEVALIMFTLIICEMMFLLGILSYVLPFFIFLLGILTGVVQAFIFAILTLTYISSAIAEIHE